MINIKRLKELAKRLVNTRREMELLLKQIYSYKKGEPTSSDAHLAMIRLFMETGGISNDLISWATGEPPDSFLSNGIIADQSQSLHNTINHLTEKGYVVYPGLFGSNWCDELLEYALSKPGINCPTDESLTSMHKPELYERLNPKATRFAYNATDIAKHPSVQNLLADNSILSLVQLYLGSLPIVDIVALWWSTAYKESPDKEAAQWWHFDMDRPKWLKMFVYLTDVHEDNGPHSFIEGSHSNNGIPYSLRSKGYTRLDDELISKYFSKNRIVEFTAPKGTVIIEDTRGLHKGKNLKSGDRLILQFEYCSSLFGAKLSPIPLSGNLTSSLHQQLTRTPSVYKLFDRSTVN